MTQETPAMAGERGLIATARRTVAQYNAALAKRDLSTLSDCRDELADMVEPLLARLAPPATSSAVEALREIQDTVRGYDTATSSQTDVLDEVDRIACAALEAGTEVAVKAGIAVKPLEWGDGEFASFSGKSLGCEYNVRLRSDGVWTIDTWTRTFESRDAAKAAAQTDYESRIRSALAPVQQAGVESELVEPTLDSIVIEPDITKPTDAYGDGYVEGFWDAKARYEKAIRPALSQLQQRLAEAEAVNNKKNWAYADVSARLAAAEAALAASDAKLAEAVEACDIATYCLYIRDFAEVSLKHPDDGTKTCIGTNTKALDAARRLKTLGLVTIEDSAQGPLIGWNPDRHDLRRARSFTSSIQEKASPKEDENG